MTSKSLSGGTTTSWDDWATVWCKYEKKNGSINGNGSQQNVVYDARITIYYSELVRTFLNKDTKVNVGGTDYQIVDYTVDKRKPVVEIRAVAKLKGTTGETTSTMKSILHTVTSGEVTAGYFIELDTKNRTIISIETQRDLVATIITEGTPTGGEIKYTAATGRYDVASAAPLVEGEKFRILYK